MLDVTKSLPEDPAELRAFTALLLAEVKAQAVLIERLWHQLAGHRAHRIGPHSRQQSSLDLHRFRSGLLLMLGGLSFEGHG